MTDDRPDRVTPHATAGGATDDAACGAATTVAGVPDEPPHPRRSAWIGWAGFGLGVALLAGAAWVVASNPEAFFAIFDRLADAPWWAVAVILVGPLLNWLLVSSCLWMLMRRHGPLAWGEMNALVGSAWLLNHLPMRPGLIGRVGYHKLVNGIRVRDSVESTVWSLVLASVSGVMGLALAFSVPPGSGAWTVILVLVGPPILIGLSGLVARWSDRTGWAWMLGALALRYADVALWAGRYAVVFWLMGVELTPVQIVLITGVSQLAQLVPIAGGGMGLREWLVGLTAGSMAHAFDAALAGDLINRAAETLVVLPLGLVCGAVVARRVRRFRAAHALTAPKGAAA